MRKSQKMNGTPSRAGINAAATKAYTDELRRKAKEYAREGDRSRWKLAKVLAEIDTLTVYKEWEYETFAEYAEDELVIRGPNARHYIKVVTLFGSKEEALRETPWSKLTETLPIVEQCGLDRALEVLQESLGAIREWKAKHLAGEEDPPTEGWERWRLSLWIPPDLKDRIEETVALATEYCLHAGITVNPKNPYAAWEAIVTECVEGLRAGIPREIVKDLDEDRQLVEDDVPPPFEEDEANV